MPLGLWLTDSGWASWLGLAWLVDPSSLRSLPVSKTTKWEEESELKTGRDYPERERILEAGSNEKEVGASSPARKKRKFLRIKVVEAKWEILCSVRRRRQKNYLLSIARSLARSLTLTSCVRACVQDRSRGGRTDGQIEIIRRHVVRCNQDNLHHQARSIFFLPRNPNHPPPFITEGHANSSFLLFLPPSPKVIKSCSRVVIYAWN